MIFVFKLCSPALANGTPASDLDQEEWTFQAADEDAAWTRAKARLLETFSLASAERKAATWLHFVGTYASKRAYEAAQEAA